MPHSDEHQRRVPAARGGAACAGSPVSPARPGPPSCSTARPLCSSTGAIRCKRARRPTPDCSRCCRRRKPKLRTGSRASCRRARSSATTPRCTPSRRSSASPRRSASPASSSSRSRPIRSMLLWSERPKPRHRSRRARIRRARGKKRAGEDRQAVQALLKEEKADAVLLTLLDSIAWLFNIRGGDIKHTPVALAFALVPASGRPTLFIDPAKLSRMCGGSSRNMSSSAPDRSGRGAAYGARPRPRALRLDPETTAIRFAHGSKPPAASSCPATIPASLPRRSRTRRRSQARGRRISATASAMTRFLAWLDEMGSTGKVDEIARRDQARRVPARHRASSRTSASTRSRPSGRTARSCITGRPIASEGNAQIRLALSHRLRRPISRRDDRRDAHRRDRRADAPRCGGITGSC